MECRAGGCAGSLERDLAPDERAESNPWPQFAFTYKVTSAHAEGGEERQDDGQHEQHGGENGPQEDHQDHEDDEQGQRDEHPWRPYAPVLEVPPQRDGRRAPAECDEVEAALYDFGGAGA